MFNRGASQSLPGFPLKAWGPDGGWIHHHAARAVNETAVMQYS
jgi:hypothetical protein